MAWTAERFCGVEPLNITVPNTTASPYEDAYFLYDAKADKVGLSDCARVCTND